MKLFETLCGARVGDLQSNQVLLESTRRSQEVRTRQSLLSLTLVAVVGIGYMWALWDHTNQVVLTLWVLVIIALTVWRSAISKRVRKNLENADAQSLVQNEQDLVFTGIALPIVIGAGYWLFSSPDDNITTLAVTLICCLYAIGSTVNTVAQRRMQALMVSLNLGQGVVFFAVSGVTEYYALAIQVSALLLLLLGFAKRMNTMFVDIVTSQLEVREQNKQLVQNRIELEVALEDSVSANQSKSQFLAAASHDLSQPLHAMSMFIGNLKQTIGADEKQRELVEKIETTSEILKHQFDGLLDMTRYDAGGVTVQKQVFDLYSLCEIIVQNENLDAQHKGVKLAISGDAIEVNSDPVLLGRLVGNLVSNAIKFTNDGSVELKIEHSGDHASLTVVDTGCGFRDADKERIFDDYVQLDNVARNRNKGVGLGLSIVRRIANLLGVTVAVESTPAVGSKFILSIPQDEAAIATIHKQRSASAVGYLEPSAENHLPSNDVELDGLNVLVVDDDLHIREALGEFIVSRGGNVLLASSFAEAIQIKDNDATNIDFAVVDDMLGSDQTGLELASTLANDISLNRIIIVTGNILPQRMEILRSSGFGIYLKPLSANKMDEILSERLNYRVRKARA